MNWQTPYIVVRPSGSELLILNSSETLRDARYFLQYFAEPRDAIFTTPIHEQYKGGGSPTYMCSLLERGKMDFHEEAWTKDVGLSSTFEFKDIQSIQQKSKGKETKIIELVNNTQSNFSLEELESHFNLNSKALNILFSEPRNWKNWNSLISQKSKDLFIVSVRSDSAWPLTLTLQSNGKDLDSDIKFVVKPRLTY